MKLRPYQQQGFNQIFSSWEEVDILFFVLATGGGKTVTFTEVIRRFVTEGKRIALIAHREELITQAHRTLKTQGINSGIIKSGYPERYEFKVQVGSIQTMFRRKNLPEFDLIVIDEGHHVQKDNSYGTILAKYPDAKLLVVTATPYRLSGNGFADITPGRKVKLIVNCTLKQLIEDGWLVPIKYHVGSIPDMTGVAIVKGDYSEEDTRKVMELAPLVESYIRHANGMQGICFCVNVAHSKNTVEKYLEAGIPSAHIDAETPQEERDKILSDFRKNKIKVVCNVGILTEGTDFPLCQFVQLAAPTKSLSKYLQEVGRVTRTLPGTVDCLDTAEERISAINASSKPYGIVLDNAGLWLDHGFPDDEHDWHKYFSGWKKIKEPKKEAEQEFIEMLIFEIEEPDTGTRRRTENPQEVEGMILIEITREMRENYRALKHLKEFDRIYKFACDSDKINKPGFFTYYKFLTYCNDRNIVLNDTSWKYMQTILVDNVENEIEYFIKVSNNAGRIVIPSINIEVAKIRIKGVNKIFLKIEQEKYKANLTEQVA